MNKRQLGKTDINLTAIGFGGAPLGNLFENLDERNCYDICLLYTSPSPRDVSRSRMPSSA